MIARATFRFVTIFYSNRNSLFGNTAIMDRYKIAREWIFFPSQMNKRTPQPTDAMSF